MSEAGSPKAGKAPKKKAEGGGGGGGKPPDKKAEAKAAKASRNSGPPAGETAHDPNYVPRLKKHYLDVVRPELVKQFGYKNLLQAPRIEKIVLNIGAGEGASDTKKIQSALNDLTAIAGQKGVITRSKKAIAAFKITAGRPVGVR